MKSKKHMIMTLVGIGLVIIVGVFCIVVKGNKKNSRGTEKTTATTKADMTYESAEFENQETTTDAQEETTAEMKEDKYLENKEIVFSQKTSSADGASKAISDGISLKNWYTWITTDADGLNELMEYMKKPNMELWIKYKGEYNMSLSLTHWGSVSGVSYSRLEKNNNYKYVVYDEAALDELFNKYNSNEANITENGNIKQPVAMSIDGRENDNKCNIVYGIYVVNTKPMSPEEKRSVFIDTKKTFQTIDGFGASYTWYSNWLPGVDRAEEAYDWIFRDAQFNILRFRDQHGLSGDERKEPIEGYIYYKAYYDAAIARGIKPIVMVTSWGQYDRTLPFVDCIEKSEKGFSYYTLAKDAAGNYMYDELASFCVQSIQYFLDAGIPVDYFSISNEIELQERHVDENGDRRDEAGFFLGPEETKDYCSYEKAHIAVYNAFKKAFGDKAPSIIGAETMSGASDLLGNYLDSLIEKNPNYFDVVAHHLYGTSLSNDNFSDISDKFSNYRIWQTEWYNNNYFQLGDVILNELIYENLNAFLYWNGVWIEDDGNCLIEISTWEKNAKLKRMPGHYIMMHFSRFIKNGYKRVDVEENMKSTVGAFTSPDGKELVVIASNTSDKAEDMELKLKEKIKKATVYQSVNGNENYMKQVEGYKDIMSVPAQSLTTIVLQLE